MADQRPILLFDGECNLCNGSVNFVLKHERSKELKFGHLQSDQAKVLLKHSSVDPSELSSMVLIVNGQVLRRSKAAFELGRYLKAPWSWARVFSILPTFITDLGYDLIAKNRYTWFGKTDQCVVPTLDLKKRFIDYSENEMVPAP